MEHIGFTFKGEFYYEHSCTAATRERNLHEGVVVDEQIWQQCLDLAAGKMETKDISTGRVFNNMQDEEKK